MNGVAQDVLAEAEAIFRLSQEFTKICKCNPMECGGGRNRIALLEEENALLKGKLRDCQTKQRAKSSERDRLADELKRAKEMLEMERSAVQELKSKIDRWGRDGDPSRELSRLQAALDEQRLANSTLRDRFEREKFSSDCRCGTMRDARTGRSSERRSGASNSRYYATVREDEVKTRSSSHDRQAKPSGDSFSDVEERIRKIKQRASSMYDEETLGRDRAGHGDSEPGSPQDGTVTCCRKKTVTTTTCKTNPSLCKPHGASKQQAHSHRHHRHCSSERKSGC